MTSILRQRMLDALVLSGKAARTQEAYIGACSAWCATTTAAPMC